MATKKEEIVIGSSLSALIFAYNNELPIYFSEPKEPRLIDYMNPDDNVDLFGIENTTQTMRSFGEEKIIGVRKSILWGRLLFILALDGKAPVSNLCKSMRYSA
jgi:hypothetical protein